MADVAKMKRPAQVKRGALKHMKVDGDVVDESPERLDIIFESAMNQASGALAKAGKGSIDLGSLPQWGYRTKKVCGTKGMPAVLKFFTHDAFSMHEKIASQSSGPGSEWTQTGTPQNPDDYFEARNILVSIIYVLNEACQGKSKHDLAIRDRLFMIQPEKQECGIILQFDSVRCYTAPDGTEVPMLGIKWVFNEASDVDREAIMWLTQEVKNAQGKKGDGNLFINTSADTADSVRLLALMLDHNGRKLSSASVATAKRAWRAPACVSRKVGLSYVIPFLPFSTGMATKVENKTATCAGCGVSAKVASDGLKACGGCGKASYCARECQKKHWKVHKQECGPVKGKDIDFSDASVVTVKHPDPALKGQAFSMISWTSPTAADPMKNMTSLPDKLPAKGFLVKVQVPMVGADVPISIYPRDRCFTTMVSNGSPAFTTLARIVQARGFMGAKLYMWAVRKGPNDLALQLKTIPSQEQNW